jgi:NitT/TauT family transport system substrate-binding protein
LSYACDAELVTNDGWERSQHERLSGAIATPFVQQLDAGKPFAVLAGMHVGCFELVGGERIRSMGDFKGKKVAVTTLGSGRHVFAASMAVHVGLDPRKEIEWITTHAAESMRQFADSKIDGFMGFPPEPQELRRKKIGRVIISTATDRPWSQYFCCLVFAGKDFVARRPVATKRALRAVLKATSLCGLEPERGARARARADRGYDDPQGYALQALKELPYARWREYKSRRHPALLRAPAQRGQLHHVEPAEDPGCWRLAVPERAQEGTEGIA